MAPNPSDCQSVRIHVYVRGDSPLLDFGRDIVNNPTTLQQMSANFLGVTPTQARHIFVSPVVTFLTC